MAKKRTRTHVTWQGRKIVLPKGVKSLNQRLKDTIDTSVTASDWNKAKNPDKCRVVFWTKSRVGVRCEGRDLAAKRRTVGKRVAKSLCRVGGPRKTGKQKFKAMRFKRC